MTDQPTTLTLTLETGDVVINLRNDVAPGHVARIAELANEGFYDGVVFHRVIAGFMELSAALYLLIYSESASIPKIIDFSIDYLRAGHFRDTYAQCQLWRQGRRVTNVAITAWQGDRDTPIATARAHFKIEPEKPLK